MRSDKNCSDLATQVTGLVLAGGRARRMNGIDKGLVMLNGKPMVSYVCNALRQQVKLVAINANRNINQYAELGMPVWPDTLTGYLGPLCGILSGLKMSTTPYIAICPCDGPFIPVDFVKRMTDTLMSDSTEIAVAHDGKRMQPVYALLKTDLEVSLLNYLESGERKIDHWYQSHKLSIVDFSDQIEKFENINTIEQRNAMEHRIAAK